MSRFQALLLSLCLFYGCNLQPVVPPQIGEDESALKAFTSESDLADYFRREITSRGDGFSGPNSLEGRGDQAAEDSAVVGAAPTPSDGSLGTAPPTDSGALTSDSDATGSGFSTTTTQEAGVDEADVLKTDGTYLYLIDDSTQNHSTLRIVRAVPAENMAVMSEVALDGYGRELYLRDGKLVALTATYGGIVYFGGGIAVEGDASSSGGSTGAEPSGGAGDDAVSSDAGEDLVNDVGILPVEPPFAYEYERPHMTVTVIDGSDPAHPVILSETRFDGSTASSRMIDGVLHLVIANYQHYFLDVMPRLGEPAFNAATVETETLIPRYERKDADGNTAGGDLLTWRELYHPATPDGFGVVSLVSMDVDNGATFSAVGVVAEPGLIYSSTEALYLTNTSYDFTGALRTSTNVYKFTYVNGQAVPTAAGGVPGRILNQYSMGEYQGVLRVATTVDPIFSFDGQITESENSVYCLEESGGSLSMIGRLEHVAPGETIQSARFTGDRGYLVTFEQVDPLFTLDLADPTNPRIVGELKVPGFSTFLVPMDRDHVLAVGQYVPPDGSFQNNGVQLSIFDVSDFANPLQTHNLIIGEGMTAWSEALYDPKAFTYLASEGLIALPASIYDYSAIDLPTILDGDGVVREDVVDGGVGDGTDAAPPADDLLAPVVPQGFEGLLVFRVSAETGFSELGRMSTQYDRPGFYTYTSFTRGVFIQNGLTDAFDVYAVTNQGVRTAPVSNVNATPSELFYGQLFPVYIGPEGLFEDDGSTSTDSKPG